MTTIIKKIYKSYYNFRNHRTNYRPSCSYQILRPPADPSDTSSTHNHKNNIFKPLAHTNNTTTINIPTPVVPPEMRTFRNIPTPDYQASHQGSSKYQILQGFNDGNWHTICSCCLTNHLSMLFIRLDWPAEVQTLLLSYLLCDLLSEAIGHNINLLLPIRRFLHIVKCDGFVSSNDVGRKVIFLCKLSFLMFFQLTKNQGYGLRWTISASRFHFS